MTEVENKKLMDKRDVWFDICYCKPFVDVPITVVTKWGKRAAVSPSGGLMIEFMFTDTNNPQANINLPSFEIQAWQFADIKDLGKMYVLDMEEQKRMKKLMALANKESPVGERVSVKPTWTERIKTFFSELF